MRRRALALCLCALLVCGACAARQESREETPPEGEYAVYFLSDPDRQREDTAALDREFRPLPEGAGEVEGLLELLLSGPESGELTSPFPENTGVLSWSLEEGLVTVDLSEAYGGLSGVELSLADGCIVLTLCQLRGVERVYLTVEGRPRPFRDQILSAEDFLLSAGEGP